MVGVLDLEYLVFCLRTESGGGGGGGTLEGGRRWVDFCSFSRLSRSSIILRATAVGSSLLWKILPVLIDLGLLPEPSFSSLFEAEYLRLLLPLVELSRRLEAEGGMIELDLELLPLELYRCAVAVACCILVVEADRE